MKGILSILLLALSLNVFASTCIGTWVTIDDKTGKKKSKVELYKKDGEMFGRIKYLYPREGRAKNPKCTKCTGDRKNKPLIDLLIVGDMKWSGSEWYGGYILDPENGKYYECKVWLNPNNPDRLYVRGYVGIFYRTQTWVRTTPVD